MEKPKILLITAHDLGDYLGCYGTPVSSPNLDALAKQGVLFENHFSTGTMCSPSRGSIITGCYPHTNGLTGLVHRGFELDVHRCPTLPQMLGEQGYATHLFGRQHEHWDPRATGYQHIHQAGDLMVKDVVGVFAQWLKAQPSDPFLAAMGFGETHRIGGGFHRPEHPGVDPADVVVRPYLPDIPLARQDLAEFYGMIMHMDAHMGLLFRALDDAGLADNTLLIFTCDHGASFMHSKGTLYDGGTKVPLIVRWPGKLPAGRRAAGLSSHVDILPTLMELIGIDVPDHVQGASLTPVLRGEADHVRECVFAEKVFTTCYCPQRMARSRDIKYIRKRIQSCIFDSVITELEVLPWSFRRTPEVFKHYSARRCTEELYDLNTDPGELTNVADDPDYQGRLAEMRKVLDQHLEATEDPFRDPSRDIPLPENAFADWGRATWGVEHGRQGESTSCVRRPVLSAARAFTSRSFPFHEHERSK